MEKAQERDLADQVFSTRNFVRTLSYREFITSLSLALLLLAFHQLLDYYSDEHWVKNNATLINWSVFSILLPLNHVFYKIEHRRQNNFIGRYLHDYIFLIFFLTLLKLQFFINNESLSFNIEGVGSVMVLLFMFALIVFLIELVVVIVKRILKFLRWQVL